jgi:hypothetical protein
MLVHHLHHHPSLQSSLRAIATEARRSTVKGVCEVRGATLAVCGVTLGVTMIVGPSEGDTHSCAPSGGSGRGHGRGNSYRG